MLIYVFVEHYPNRYKPFFDTQFANFISHGHEIIIFALGKFVGVENDEIKKYQLDKKVRYFPTTLKTIPMYFCILLLKIVRSPILCIYRVFKTADIKESYNKNIIRCIRAILLPKKTPDICLIHSLATASMFDFLSKIYTDCRVSLYYHGGEVGGAPKVNNESQIFRQMHKVFTNTESSRLQTIKRGCPKELINVIPVGFNLEHYIPDTHKNYRINDTLRLISVGRLSMEKGLIYALQAIKKVVDEYSKKIHYTIIGQGPERNTLMNFVSQYQLSSYVSFVGSQNRNGVIKYLEQSDVLILPSIMVGNLAETQACVVQEAMLMRLPVIYSTVGGVPESVPDVMKPLAVQCNDSDAIANAIKRVMSLSNDNLVNMAEKARCYVEKNYNIEVTNHALLSALSE